MGLRDERSSTIKDMFWNGRGFSQPGFLRHNRVVNGAVIDLDHVSCDNCKKKIGDWSNVPLWSPGDLPIVHPKCGECDKCVIHGGIVKSWTQKRDGSFAHDECLDCHMCNKRKKISAHSGFHARSFIEELDGRFVHSDCKPCDLCMTAEKGRFVDKTTLEQLSVCEQAANIAAGSPLTADSYIHRGYPKGVKRKFDDVLAAQPSKPRKRARK